eukprot:SAG25_NODE_202_length_11981_cov_16.926612_12_plen_62_part_00
MADKEFLWLAEEAYAHHLLPNVLLIFSWRARHLCAVASAGTRMQPACARTHARARGPTVTQ